MAGQAATDGRNKLLALLPKAERERLERQAEPVELGLRDMIYEPNQPITHAYFPLNCVLSMIAVTDGGVEIEVATTGSEGMLGLPLFLGVDRTPLKAFSQVPGASLRLEARRFRQALKDEPRFAGVLNRFTQALMMQISQSAACNRAHPIEQRCCRWLLMTHDRVHRDNFMLTQEFLAQMLGVRRATVGEIAADLQNERLIRYNRGVIEVLNRRGLEKRTCGCYFVIRDEYDRVLNGNFRK